MRTLFFYVFFNAKGEVIDPMNKRRMRLMGKLVAQNKWLFIGAALCVLISVVIDYLTPLLLAETLGGAAQGSVLSYAGKTYLVRCAQTLPGSAAGEGDVLAAHRAKDASGAELCILAGTDGFSPAAQRAAEWMEPPIRLIAGRQLALLFGQQHPATDAEIARRARRQRTPFSRGRIRALALAPAKQGRYLLVAFLLALLYLFLRSLLSLVFALTAFVLAMLCARENRKAFRL